jgi:hypothetical protein
MYYVSSASRVLDTIETAVVRICSGLPSQQPTLSSSLRQVKGLMQEDNQMQLPSR